MPHWVFGFGSLMWNPGFDFVERQPALLRGRHRVFSIRSNVSWGSDDRPGLVVALHPGGSCQGYAFRIAAAKWPETDAYLRDRERAYRHAEIPVVLENSIVTATTFLFDENHPRAVGELNMLTTAQMIAQGVGKNGSSFEYLTNIILELKKDGRPTPQKLMKIKALVDRIKL